jgi:hypothetical protein
MASMTESQAPTERHDPHAGESMVGPHGDSMDHGDTHGHDDHAHAGMGLGPINTTAWALGLLGIVLGFVVAIAFLAAAR